MRGGEGAELGSSPWEPSTTAEELVWRRKIKAERERETWGEVRRQAGMARVFREPQSLWKRVQAQKCLPKLRVLAPRETRATESGHKATLTKSPRVSTKGPYDEVHDGRELQSWFRVPTKGKLARAPAPCSTHPPYLPAHSGFPVSQGLSLGRQEAV